MSPVCKTQTPDQRLEAAVIILINYVNKFRICELQKNGTFTVILTFYFQSPV